MLRPNPRPTTQRRGATLVESALVYSVLFLVLFGIIVGATGMFRYQQVSSMAREGSRWASVHGAQYAKEQGQPAATSDDVFTQSIQPQAASMGLSELGYTVTWDRDNSTTHTEIQGNQVVAKSNTVTVTVTYNWKPGLIFGTIPLTSTSVSIMHY